jgi:hypothetical protein
MNLSSPTQQPALADIEVPDEFYWVLQDPVPLGGMCFPRPDFPWQILHDAGFRHVVVLEPGDYDPSPLSIVFSDYLEDLSGGGQPEDADAEEDLVNQATEVTLAALERGEGVVVHCQGGRGRTGTVLGCVLARLGYPPNEIFRFLDDLHKSRGRPGWPESPWQSELVSQLMIRAIS